MNQNPEKLSYQLRHSMLAIQFLQLKSSYLDNTLRFRLAGVSDLIAAMVKYHKNLTSKSKKESQKRQTLLCFLSVLSSTLLQSVTKYFSYVTYGGGIIR